MTDKERLQAITGGMLRPGGYEVTERGLGFCDITGESIVLDGGCGTGFTVRYLKDRYTSNVYGVDLSGTLLAEARGCGRGQALAQATLESLPFRNGSFDGIISECVLCHTDAPRVLEEFFRVLKPAGFLILSDLYRRSRNGDSPAEAKGTGLMTEAAIGQLFARSGFRITHWEDRTGDLKRLAAGLMLAYGAFPELFLCNDSRSVCEGVGSRKDLGYYLIVATATGGPA